MNDKTIGSKILPARLCIATARCESSVEAGMDAKEREELQRKLENYKDSVMRELEEYDRRFVADPNSRGTEMTRENISWFSAKILEMEDKL